MMFDDPEMLDYKNPQCCMCKAQQTRLDIVEAKLDALEYYFSHIQMDDDLTLMTDLNLENLLKQLSTLNNMRGMK